jgi:hypothetical protein
MKSGCNQRKNVRLKQCFLMGVLISPYFVPVSPSGTPDGVIIGSDINGGVARWWIWYQLAKLSRAVMRVSQLQ